MASSTRFTFACYSICTRISLCLRRDNSITAIDKISTEDTQTLEWTRRVVCESSNVIQLFCPVLYHYEAHRIHAFMALCMYYSGLVSIFACEWFPRPDIVGKSIAGIESIFKFMEYAAKSWGFAHELISALRRVIIECDFESKLPTKTIDELSKSEMSLKENHKKEISKVATILPTGTSDPDVCGSLDSLWRSTRTNTMVRLLMEAQTPKTLNSVLLRHTTAISGNLLYPIQVSLVIPLKVDFLTMVWRSLTLNSRSCRAYLARSNI